MSLGPLDALVPSKFSTAQRTSYLALIQDPAVTWDNIKAFIATYFYAAPQEQLQAKPRHAGFLASIFVKSPLVQYNIRNRALVSLPLFCMIVESLFAAYYVSGDVAHAITAADLGLNPLLFFNVLPPYFMRIVETVLQPAAPGVPGQEPKHRHLLSFTVLQARYVQLLATPEFTKPFAFTSQPDFVRYIEDIYTIFTPLEPELTAQDQNAARDAIIAAWTQKKAEWRAAIKAAAQPLKLSLAETVFHPGRVWRLSLAQGMYAWEWLDEYHGSFFR